jgi:hypothetical protein
VSHFITRPARTRWPPILRWNKPVRGMRPGLVNKDAGKQRGVAYLRINPHIPAASSVLA